MMSINISSLSLIRFSFAIGCYKLREPMNQTVVSDLYQVGPLVNSAMYH